MVRNIELSFTSSPLAIASAICFSHISGIENYNLVNYAIKAGIKKILIPANNLNDEEKILEHNTNLQRNVDYLYENLKSLNSKYFLPFANFNELYHKKHLKYVLNSQSKNRTSDVVKFLKDYPVKVVHFSK